MTEITDKLDSIKIKNLCPPKDTGKTMKETSHRLGENIRKAHIR